MANAQNRATAEVSNLKRPSFHASAAPTMTGTRAAANVFGRAASIQIDNVWEVNRGVFSSGLELFGLKVSSTLKLTPLNKGLLFYPVVARLRGMFISAQNCIDTPTNLQWIK